MDLPIRILSQAPDYPVILVDGAFEGHRPAHLHLSHWPGNSTPLALKHDLSSGIALNFARLPPARQEALAGCAQALVNSHYDSDGALALFCLRHPEQALRWSEPILAAAAAGDFFHWPSDHALALDAIITGLSHSERSPLAKQLAGLDQLARWQVASEHLMESLPALLAGDLAGYGPLWEPTLERARGDRLALVASHGEAHAQLELQVWSSDKAPFSPGRHVLFQASALDRALVLQVSASGTRARLIESTRTWFDLVSRAKRPRPDLLALADELNDLEASRAADPHAWRAQPANNASPELWFGLEDQIPFAEHNPGLAWSSLSHAQIKGCVMRHLALQPD